MSTELFIISVASTIIMVGCYCWTEEVPARWFRKKKTPAQPPASRKVLPYRVKLCRLGDGRYRWSLEYDFYTDYTGNQQWFSHIDGGHTTTQWEAMSQAERAKKEHQDKQTVETKYVSLPEETE